MKKNNKNLFTRFYNYQLERFPILVILLTGFSVIISSAAVALPEGQDLYQVMAELILALIVSVLFMYHIRVIDEFRDHKFDSKYHPNRPVQRGLISLRELLIIDFFGIILQFLINFNFSNLSMLLWISAFGYTIISGNDFFLGDRIKKRFFLYNLLNLVQLFIFQFYLYSIFNPQFSFFDILLVSHFIFAILNVSLLEFTRKVKSSSMESLVKDTYSSRFGREGACSILIIIALFSFAIFTYSLFALSMNFFLFSGGLVFLNLVIFGSIIYLFYDNKISELFLQGFSILFYIGTHLLLSFSKL